MDTLFYRMVRPIVKFIFYILFRPTIVGKENIQTDEALVLAGNHTKWLDPVLLVAVNKRQVHFLAKEELFHGITKFVVKGMGCIPVNRKIHDKDALKSAKAGLDKGCCIGVFPEGTINRTKDVIMPFKIGAVKMSFDTGSFLVPFVITGKYRLFRKSIKIEFLPRRKVGSDLDKENKKLMLDVSRKLEVAKNEK